MTRQELRVFLDSWWCGCGIPESAAARLRDVLALHPLYDHRKEFEQLLPDSGFQHLILYILDHFDLTEHGSGVGGGWLTDKGKAVLEALNRESLDGFETLTAGHCAHGYNVDTELMDCPECSKLNS